MANNIFLAQDINYGITHSLQLVIAMLPLFYIVYVFIDLGNIFCGYHKHFVFMHAMRFFIKEKLGDVCGSAILYVTMLPILLGILAVYNVLPCTHTLNVLPGFLMFISFIFWRQTMVAYGLKPFPQLRLREICPDKGYIVSMICLLTEVCTIMVRPVTLFARIGVHSVIPPIIVGVLCKSIEYGVYKLVMYTTFVFGHIGNFFGEIVDVKIDDMELVGKLFCVEELLRASLVGVVMFSFTLYETFIMIVQVVLFTMLIVHYYSETTTSKLSIDEKEKLSKISKKIFLNYNGTKAA